MLLTKEGRGKGETQSLDRNLSRRGENNFFWGKKKIFVLTRAHLTTSRSDLVDDTRGGGVGKALLHPHRELEAEQGVVEDVQREEGEEQDVHGVAPLLAVPGDDKRGNKDL